jgi:tRNA(Ser,Leu) C12 N-acetylase TAN1
VNRHAHRNSVGGEDGPLASDDYGLTAHEQRERESLDRRLAREARDIPSSRSAWRMSDAVVQGIPRWNVVVTFRGDPLREALELLRQFGSITPTTYYNVATMHVDAPDRILDELGDACKREPRAAAALSRVVPLQRAFTFSTRDEFERHAAAIASEWSDDLGGSTFHVRVHRRGGVSALDEADQEALLGEVILGVLEEAGTPGRITFDDPDAVIDIEAIDDEAGMSLWTRDDLADYPLLRVE